MVKEIGGCGIVTRVGIALTGTLRAVDTQLWMRGTSNAFNSHNNPRMCILVFFIFIFLHFTIQETEAQSNNLPKVTKLVNRAAGIQIQVTWLQDLCS